MKRRMKYSIYVTLGLVVLGFGLDDLIARFRSDEFSTIRVDQVYAITNRWNQVDYSIGKPQNERCVNALFPHAGSVPCWYVRSHTLNYVRGGN